MKVISLRLTLFKNIGMEGRVSQIFHLGPSSYFMTKKRVTSCHFLQKQYSTFHKTKN